MMTSSLDIPLEPSLMPEQAREIVAQGEDAAVFALLETAKLLAQQQVGSPSDSDWIPPELAALHERGLQLPLKSASD